MAECATKPLRLLFITLEFQAGCFSGNGVYAQSQVASLRALGHQVLVIAGCPEDCEGTASSHHLEVSCPLWGQLDQDCSWLEFAAGARTNADAVAAFCPEAILGVDWHSLPVWRGILQVVSKSMDSPNKSGMASTPFIYLNYRVYTRTAEGAARAVIYSKECACVEAAAATVCLSRSDAAYILDNMAGVRKHSWQLAAFPATGLHGDKEQQHIEAASTRASNQGTHSSTPFVLLPALRSDMESIHPKPLQDALLGLPQRPYLTCCVRLSPEKEADRFVAAIECLAQPPSCGVSTSDASSSRAADPFAVKKQPLNRLQKLRVVPLLCGAATTPYAKALQDRLLTCAPESVLKTQFLGASDLAQVFAATRVNVHPCCYDAFGMTVVEAASQGAPSLLMGGGSIGATDLLSTHKECFVTDMAAAPSHLADEIERLAQDAPHCAKVGMQAMTRARDWTQLANATDLISIVEGAIAKSAE